MSASSISGSGGIIKGQNLTAELDRLSADDDAEAVVKRRRGRKLERLIRDCLDRDGLDPRASYKPDGEEVDGSFVLGDRVFLLEAKWVADPLPASQLYAFKGKVDGKLCGTIGVVISMSGYSKEAVDALIAGKAVNIILFDRNDFRTGLDPTFGFRRAMIRKLRAAAEEGTPYFPLTRSAPTLSGPSPSEILFVVEARRDQEILQALAERLMNEGGSRPKFAFVPAQGKMNIPRVAASILDHCTNQTVVAVADADGDEGRTLAQLTAAAPPNTIIPIVASPTLEAWLTYGMQLPPLPDLGGISASIQRQAGLHDLVARLNLDRLADRSSGFRQFASLFGWPQRSID